MYERCSPEIVYRLRPVRNQNRRENAVDRAKRTPCFLKDISITYISFPGTRCVDGETNKRKTFSPSNPQKPRRTEINKPKNIRFVSLALPTPGNVKNLSDIPRVSARAALQSRGFFPFKRERNRIFCIYTRSKYIYIHISHAQSVVFLLTKRFLI